MALNPILSNAAASLAADAVCGSLNSGLLRIYDGTQPATADTAITTQNLLAELTLNATAFAAAVNGVATANAITSDASANMSGTATWCRVLTSGAATRFDGTVGTSGCNLNLSTVAILATGTVAVSSLTYTHPKS